MRCQRAMYRALVGGLIAATVASPVYAAGAALECAERVSPPPCAHEANSEDRIKCLIEAMTLSEKVGQLGVFSRPGGSDFNPGTSSDWNATVLRLRNGSIGALYNGAGVAPNRELQCHAVEGSRLGIPIIFGADIWHGMHTIFPIPLAEAATFEPALAEQTARATALETTASGIHWTYSPMVDTARDQRWGRVAEGAGEDPHLGEHFAAARVHGFQGRAGLNRNDSLAACLKHFAGYGGVAAGLDYSATDVSEATFRDVFLPPFKAGIDAGALTVMSAFSAILGGVPASGSHWLQTQVLRHEMGFSGFVVSDYQADVELVDHGFASDDSDAAHKAFHAGVDMSMQSGAYLDHLPALVQRGKVSQSMLDEGVRRVLRGKAAMGLLDDPYRSLDEAAEKASLADVPRFDELALSVSHRSMVLLKNEGEILPLRATQRIALIGWWVDDRQNAEGVGVIWGNKSAVVTLAEGFAKKTSLFRVQNGSGVEERIVGGIRDAIQAAAWADVVVLALGEPHNYDGEAQSRTDIVIPNEQQRLAEAVASIGKPVVVLLKNGRALALEGAVRNAQAILVTWFLGKMTGDAIADVLFGHVSPSGRLPVSFPLRSGQQPYFYNHMSSGRPCRGQAYQNCWREVPNEALYPFGHGLTYTRFEYSKPVVSPAAGMAWNGNLSVTSTITNVGKRPGEEVVQFYVHDRVASKVRPIRELKGFRKIALAVGESAHVTFTLGRADLTFAAPQGGPDDVVEPGLFDVWVSPSATTGEAAAFELLAEPVFEGGAQDL